MKLLLLRSSTPWLLFRAAMSSHSGGAQNQRRRSFSHGPGDSNLGFRPHNSTAFGSQPPPPPHGPTCYSVSPPFYGNRPFRQPLPNTAPPFYGNRPFHQPLQNTARPFYGNRPFRQPLQNTIRHFNGNRTFCQFGSPRPQRSQDFRIWEVSKSGPPPHHSGVLFKILSYNLLAEYLAINHRSKLYFHIPRRMLDWDWRKRSIIFELGLWSADILCFQEVDRFQDLEEDLKLRGYNGIWKMRTGDPIDGCAIFWRDSRFKLLHEEFIEYNKLGLRDNVAQICVFELVNQNSDKDLSDSSRRLLSSNKVVVCNIHVLYNPKRGEIKLGQVRVLLDRAHDVSKHWDNAPVVLCGDFNCTPKSPLYNYISERKLDLLGLPRDEVSGQASSEIRPQWQFSPNIRGPKTADCRGGVTEMADSGEIGQLGSLNVNHHRNPGVSSVVPLVNCSPQFPTDPKMCDGATMVEDCINKIVLSSHETGIWEIGEEADSCENEALPASSVSSIGLEKHSNSQDREDLLVKKLEDVSESFAVDSSQKDIFHSSTPGASYSHVNICKDERFIVMGGSENSSVPVLENADIPNASSEFDVSHESSPSTLLHEKMENLSLDGIDECNEENEFLEESSTFLAELHNENASISHVKDFEPVDEVFYPYDRSAWTPMGIESATGRADCTVMEHSLKLRSSYTEAEDLSGTRDSHGEPSVTSYNRGFMGTVDYIWHSEGLETVRVLAPIPKQAMQRTAGFPTKKWGSDHIALVSELAFTNDTIKLNTELS